MLNRANTVCGFCLEWFPLSLGAWDRLRLFYCGTPWAFHIIIFYNRKNGKWQNLLSNCRHYDFFKEMFLN